MRPAWVPGVLCALVLLSPLAGPAQGTTHLTDPSAEPGAVLQAGALRFRFAAADAPSADGEAGEETDDPRELTMAVRAPEKVPVLEMYTATWCPPCAPADRAIARLLHEQGGEVAATGRESGTASGPQANATDDNATDDDRTFGAGEAPAFVFLSYHPWPDVVGTDPLGVPEGNARMRDKYVATWFPTAIVDGVLEDRPATRSTSVARDAEGVYLDSYRRLLQRAQDQTALLSLSMVATRVGEDVRLDVTLEPTAGLGQVRVVALHWQDPVHYEGDNGESEHRMVVRGVAADTGLDLRREEDPRTLRFMVPLDPEVALEEQGVTVLVERPWGDDAPAVSAHTFAILAGGIAAATVTFLAWSMRRRTRGRGVGAE